MTKVIFINPKAQQLYQVKDTNTHFELKKMEEAGFHFQVASDLFNLMQNKLNFNQLLSLDRQLFDKNSDEYFDLNDELDNYKDDNKIIAASLTSPEFQSYAKYDLICDLRTYCDYASQFDQIIRFLQHKLNGFQAWYLTGFAQGESTWCWIYDPDKDYEQPLGQAPFGPICMTDYLTSLVYNYAVEIDVLNWQTHASLGAFDWLYHCRVNDSLPEIADYMQAKYQARPAQTKEVYY